MTIEEIIKEAFSRGWNASHECATDFDYEYAINGFLSEVDTEVKKISSNPLLADVNPLKDFLLGLRFAEHPEIRKEAQRLLGIYF